MAALSPGLSHWSGSTRQANTRRDPCEDRAVYESRTSFRSIRRYTTGHLRQTKEKIQSAPDRNEESSREAICGVTRSGKQRKSFKSVKAMRVECEICKANPATDSTVVLTRVNEKGIPGVWRCQEHLPKCWRCGSLELGGICQNYGCENESK